jgi:large subunit ribosomal protein L5
MTKFDKKEINRTLSEKLGRNNPMDLPKIVFVSVNAGVGRLLGDKAAIAKVADDISLITGQKAVITKAKKSIAAFKVREENPVGVKVTIRGEKMIDFLIKLINITLPRIRDFQGIRKTSFDRQGNLSIGFQEQVFFPEIKYENVDKTFGLQVNIRTTAKNQKEAVALLSAWGLPFVKEEKNG